MKAVAEFIELRWVPYGDPVLTQGVKGRGIPDRAIAGGNGTFITLGETAKLYLTVKLPDGSYIRENIYSDVKFFCTKTRITKKVREKLERILKNKVIEVKEGHISNLPELLINL